MNLILEKQRIKQELDLVNDESIMLTIKRILGLTKDQKLHPLTKEDIVARALESEKAIKQGQFITLEELEDEMKNWQ
jgi:hypothetical protein